MALMPVSSSMSEIPAHASWASGTTDGDSDSTSRLNSTSMYLKRLRNVRSGAEFYQVAIVNLTGETLPLTAQPSIPIMLFPTAHSAKRPYSYVCGVCSM